MEKELSITVLGDLFNDISFLRFLEHFWNAVFTWTHWNRCSTVVTENFTGKLRHYHPLMRELARQATLAGRMPAHHVYFPEIQTYSSFLFKRC